MVFAQVQSNCEAAELDAVRCGWLDWLLLMFVSFIVVFGPHHSIIPPNNSNLYISIIIGDDDYTSAIMWRWGYFNFPLTAAASLHFSPKWWRYVQRGFLEYQRMPPPSTIHAFFLAARALMLDTHIAQSITHEMECTNKFQIHITWTRMNTCSNDDNYQKSLRSVQIVYRCSCVEIIAMLCYNIHHPRSHCWWASCLHHISHYALTVRRMNATQTCSSLAPRFVYHRLSVASKQTHIMLFQLVHVVANVSSIQNGCEPS